MILNVKKGMLPGVWGGETTGAKALSGNMVGVSEGPKRAMWQEVSKVRTSGKKVMGRQNKWYGFS